MRRTSPPTPSQVERLLDVAAVADTLGVCPRTVRRMIKDGRIPALRVGRSVRVRAADLNRLINNREQI